MSRYLRILFYNLFIMLLIIGCIYDSDDNGDNKKSNTDGIVNITGTWEVKVYEGGELINIEYIIINQTESTFTISGSITSSDGTIEGSNISHSFISEDEDGNTNTVICNGTVNGNTISGAWSDSGSQGTWIATKVIDSEDDGIVNITGTWEVKVYEGGELINIEYIIINQTENTFTISGDITSTNGIIEGSNISHSFISEDEDGNTNTIICNGTVNGNTMLGAWSDSGSQGTWIATKVIDSEDDGIA